MRTPFKLQSHPSPFKQQDLSVEAAQAKHNRDVIAAKTPLRQKRKRENQVIGQSSEYDLHHTKDGSVVKMKIENNRNVWKHGER
jgi:hypothetical protein